ncbi:hypothetical protein [Sphingomonas adhaesiva]|nr:hypothetical protein [Sphingomonas adhaesiva]
MTMLPSFQTATPAMIVGHGVGDDPLPMELGEPFALLGGDRLGADGIPFLVMHEHQPDFLAWVRTRCAMMLAAERPWFCGGTLILGGSNGAGRTHAARWLARIGGMSHAVVNLTDPVIAASIAASGEISEALGASPVTIAMAAARCANPIVTVVGADRVGDDVLQGLAVMIDPERCRRWREDRLGIDIDLGEVTWILQQDEYRTVPDWIAPDAIRIALGHPPAGIDHVLALSICLEAMGDLGIDPAGGICSWQQIRDAFPRKHFRSARELYVDMVQALRGRQRAVPRPFDALPF